jgi:hypothetical protein
MRRTAPKLALVVAAATLISAGSAGSADHVHASHDRHAVDPRVGPPGQGTLAGNRSAALRDVVSHLRSVRLPAGAVRVYHEPHGDSDLLAASGQAESDSGPAQAHAWWILSEPAAQVLAYVEAHRPAGASFAGSGGGGNYKTGATDQEISYSWPDIGIRVSQRSLYVTVMQLPDGKTGVLVQGWSSSTVPRPQSERVPNGVTAVRVTLQRPPKRPGAGKLGARSRVVITQRRRVAEAIKLVDALGLSQGIGSCTAMFGPPGSLTVTYSAGPAGPVLAQARIVIPVGWTAIGANFCNPIEFTVRGRTEEPALVGGSFARGILKLAELSLR